MSEGIEAWDCMFDKDVLLVPWVLAFKSDNLMASEIASHVGMTSKLYCQICCASTGNAPMKDASLDARDKLEHKCLHDYMTVNTYVHIQLKDGIITLNVS